MTPPFLLIPKPELEEDRMHVHVTSSGGKAKFWMEPEIALALSNGVPKGTSVDISHTLHPLLFQPIQSETMAIIKQTVRGHPNGGQSSESGSACNQKHN